MQRIATTFIVTLLAGVALFGCDAITGGAQEAPPPPQAVAPPAQPMPPAMPQPGTVPGQPMPRPPAQPGMPTPVQPMVQPVPGQPIPGQPVAAPGLPAPQPGVPTPVQPVPGQPVPAPAPQPGMPAPAPAVAAPGQPAPVAPGVAAPGQPTPAPAPTGDALTDALNTKKVALAANFTATSALVKATLNKGKSQAYQVQLPGPPYCHTYIAVTDEKVKNIDLTIASPTNEIQASDSTEENTAAVQNHCPTMPGVYKLSVNMPASSGEFAVQVFSK